MSKPIDQIREDETVLAARLREAREYLGLSQEEVARHLDLSRASISAIEAGKRRVQSLELRDLARLYRTTVEYRCFGRPKVAMRKTAVKSSASPSSLRKPRLHPATTANHDRPIQNAQKGN